MRLKLAIFTISALAVAGLMQVTAAETLTVEETTVVEWKPVYGQVETRDRVPARARTGGTVVKLDVTEGDRVEAGQRIAVIEDDKLQFQIDSIDARIEAQQAQLETARADLERGKQLRDRGVITAQRLDQLQTAVDVIEGQIRSLSSERLVVAQRIAEGQVLAPENGVVLSVPISLGSVLAPGEAVAVIGGGGVFLRLSVPERYAGDLQEGASIEIGTGAGRADRPQQGRLAKIYPQIVGGRVEADVEVDGLDDRFVGRRVPVRLPVASRQALLVPEAAMRHRGGLDFVAVQVDGNEVRHRTVVPGGTITRDGTLWREILTGLEAGETVVLTDE